MMKSSTALLLTLILGLFAVLVSDVQGNPFQDVSVQAGLDYSLGPRKKYGGACVADLNGDGFPDLILAHHDDQFANVFLNTGKGTFNKLGWNQWDDTHSIVPYRALPTDKNMFFLLVRGGSFGSRPTSPLIFKMTKYRQVYNLGSPPFGFGRGRTAIFLPLNPRFPAVNHVIIINVLSLSGKPTNAAARILPDGTLKQITLTGFNELTNGFATVTDIDNDGQLEFLTFSTLRMYKVSSPYRVREITNNALPRALLPIRGVVSVAELDFDNDGKMDLYIARTSTGGLQWLQSSLGSSPSDYLFRNVGGRYVDVTKNARIPGGGESRGVTVGDFNNDGYIDILITQFTGPHRLLWNNGDGTFRSGTANFGPRTAAYGDAPTAVDYDRDGKLDVIHSEGDHVDKAHAGYFRIMKNIGRHPNYLLVRVGSSPKGTASSLHAVATVQSGKLSMKRRVGSPGTTVSVSYIELLHFGLGSSQSAVVTVRWADGQVQKKTNVKANSLVQFGIV